VKSPTEIIPQLKEILEKAATPAQLDDHPWAQSLCVRQFVHSHAELNNQRAGNQLLATLSSFFRATMPSIPPRRGKRLDTAWGQFGILGALYFAPFEFNTTRPTSLLDGWGRIDDVILRYVFGRNLSDLPLAEIERYRLVGDEIETAPKSTVSGWHTKGLERLAAALIQREQNLSATSGESSPILQPDQVPPPQESENQPPERNTLRGFYRRYRREFWFGIAAIIFILVGWKSWRVLSLYRAFRADIREIQTYAEAGEISYGTLVEVGPLLTKTRQDIVSLRNHVAPFGWAGRLMGWLPIYGGDLANAEYLLDMAAGLVIAGDEGYRTVEPILMEMATTGEQPEIPELLAALEAAQPTLAFAQENVSQALQAYDQIDVASLSPKSKPLLEKAEPYLPFLSDGISILPAIPKIAGGESYGPQTYLILLQNEDEIRATGGFITAVATVTVGQGEIIAYKVEDSYEVDNFSRTYPLAPWQLDYYMYGPRLLLRDSNWSPDFPTSAMWAEHVYSYYSAHSVDGVVALDQEFLRQLLTVLGPIDLDGFPEPITADNVMAFMRAARGEGLTEEEWREVWDERKNFMGPLAQALINNFQSGDISFSALSQVILQALDSHHLLLQIDEPALAAVLARQGWDGALQPSDGDFLMVVDSNIGFNKANVVTEKELNYFVDLSDVQQPQASLQVLHTNSANGSEPCQHGSYNTHDYTNLIHRCYWNYLRIYKLADTILTGSDTPSIPAEWLLRGEDVPARVDILDNSGMVAENPAGLQAFGTMTVVPRGAELRTGFEFELPQRVLFFDEATNTWNYRLKIQKQAGAAGIPVRLQVHLPPTANLVQAHPPGEYQDGIWLLDLSLKTDVEILVRWQMP